MEHNKDIRRSQGNASMLTRKEKQVLDIIENFIEKHHYSPTFEEIAHALGIKSKSTI
ncbi:transcriptional repressor LexA, partial [Fangia hongkongensis]|nr:transcriptional repressor LexA [Fangia hongkongensis]